MRRTDRLFRIIQILRDGRLHTAAEIAEVLEVSVRTIYRDIDTLVSSGVPIEGERGVGYLAREAITLPPLTLNSEEIEALKLGMALVEKSSDTDLRAASRSLSAKLRAVLPAQAVAQADAWRFAVYQSAEIPPQTKYLPDFRSAIKEQKKLRISYQRLDGVETLRTIRPLHMEHWGRVWTLTAWCEAKENFRVFRIDRIHACEETNEGFEHEPGKRIEDYIP